MSVLPLCSMLHDLSLLLVEASVVFWIMLMHACQRCSVQ
jgi:hypothetical protein